MPKSQAKPHKVSTLSTSQVFPHHPGSVLSVSYLELDDVSSILKAASQLENEDPLKRMKQLFKRRVSLLFYESSTRTRTSFELAAKQLGAG